MQLTVELVAADRRVWSGEAAQVLARTTDGEIGILPGHAPLLGLLVEGEVKISAEEGPVIANVGGGFLSVEHDRVTIVAESAQVGASSGN
jgi:F-type H+-transporting ATPase subunit epsilon